MARDSLVFISPVEWNGMLRWCLSTVRALGGGRDSNPGLSCYFNHQILRLSSSLFSRAYTDTSVSAADLVEELETSVFPSSSTESFITGFQDASSSSFRSTMGLLEGRHPRRPASFWTSDSGIDTLRRFLSSENITSDHPLIFSPTTIRSLYYRAESTNQLGILDSKMLTLLMGFFGSLSLDPRTSVAYRVPLASRLLRASTYRTHWAFILKVGKYKLKGGIPLQDSDRFWLMCAELAMAQTKHTEPLSDDAHSAILRARTHYHIMRRHSRRPDVHAYYLETLLAIQDPRRFDLAACDLAFLIRTHRVFHPRLQRLLFRLIIQHGKYLSTRSQEAILTALWRRACRGTHGTSDFVPDNGLSDITLDDCTLDMKAMARSLSAILFGITGHLPGDKSTNSLGHLLSVFSPAHTLLLRWSSLTLFSIFNSCEIPRVNETHWTSNHAMPQVISCWHVIYGLATIEKMSRKLSSALTTQCTHTTEVLEVTRNLYQLWLMITKSSLVSRDLACAVATSFLKIASVLADSSLFYDCQELYRAENSSGGSRTSMQTFFTTQYIVAAARIRGPLPDIVLTALEAFSLDSKQQHQVLASAVKALSAIDPFLAHALYTIAQKKMRESDPGTTYILAMSFAQRGALLQAILLHDSQFSVEKRGILVSAIARSLRENPRTRHPQRVFVAIADELAALYHSHTPPEHFRGHLEQLLVVLAQHGRGSQLLPVVLSILRKLPSYFRSQFFPRYCRVLLQHKQYATASKLLDAIAAVHPKFTRSLRPLKDRIAMRALKRIPPLRGPSSLRLSSRLRRCPHAGPPLERSLQELLQSGRVLAAKHIFARAAATIPSIRCTALGNILLHGISRQPTPSNGRHVRKVLALFENLVKLHGFRPDRVTANILIRVLINWRSAFHSPRLRELFDQLVRGGYPAADYSPLHLPFDTRQMHPPTSFGISKLSSFVSFEKHSRPLFKMFIKAFYLCNDVEAARKVVGILKVEERKNAITKEARQRARTRGRIKAVQRNVVSSDTTAPSND